MSEKKPLYASAAFPLLAGVLFAAAYAVIFFIMKETLLGYYDYTIKRIPSILLYGMGTAGDLRGYGQSYGALLGIGFGVLLILGSYVLFGIAAVIRLAKRTWMVPLVTFLVAGGCALLGYFLDQTTPRTAISAATIYFVSAPLLYASLVVVVVSVISFILSLRYAAPAKTV